MHAKLNQLVLTLCNSMDCTHQAPLSMGFCRQECWSGLPCPTPGDLPNLGNEPMSPESPTLQVDSFPTESPGKPHPNNDDAQWESSHIQDRPA